MPKPWIRYGVSNAIPSTMLTAIGRVASEWSHLEYWMMVALTEVTGMKDPYGRAMLTHVQMGLQMEGMLACAKLRRDPKTPADEQLDLREYSELAAIVKEVERLRPLRNEVVHAFWMVSKKRKRKLTIYKAKSRGEFKVSFPVKTSAEVNKVAEDVATVAFRLWDWCLERGNELAV